MWLSGLFPSLFLSSSFFHSTFHPFFYFFYFYSALLSLILPVFHLILTVYLLHHTAVGAWSTCTIRTQRQTRQPWCSPRQTTVTPHITMPLRTTPASLQITSTTTPPHPLQHHPPRLITTRSVSGLVIWFMSFIWYFASCSQAVCSARHSTAGPWISKWLAEQFNLLFSANTFFFYWHSSVIVSWQDWQCLDTRMHYLIPSVAVVLHPQMCCCNLTAHTHTQ